MLYVTTATTTPIPYCLGLLITVNAAYTGTITVKDGTTTIGVITNPGVGSAFRYYGFSNSTGGSVVTNATGDITLSILNHQG